jgi:hypothetical protein
MQNAFSPLMNMYHTQLEASRRFADVIFSGTEKMDRAMIGATHRVFNEQIKLAAAMSTVRDPRNIGAALQSGLLSRNPDETVNYQQEIMRIYAEMQSDIGKSLQEYIRQLGTSASAETMQPAEPVKGRVTEDMFNPVSSMFSVWESAFKEVAALARKNMTTARSAVEEAAGRAMEGAANYANAVSETAAAQSDVAKSSIIVDADATEEKRNGVSGGGKRK